MAKRGRPPKKAILQPVPTPRKRGRPPQTQTLASPITLPHPFSHKQKDLWQNAFTLSQQVSDHYAMTVPEQELAFNLALTLNPGALMVELGVTHGRTAIILCYAAQLNQTRYVGIDNFKTEGAKMIVEQNLEKLNLSGKIIASDTQTVPWDQPIDYLLFDAGHDELNMRQDIKRWLPFVNPGGLVLFHAYNPKVEYGDPHYPVKFYTDENTKSWETINYIPYLLVKQKPL